MNKELNVRDVKNSISATKQKKEGDSLTLVINFNSAGDSDEKKKVKFKDTEICAKKMVVGKRTFYHVKQTTAGKFFDPKNVSDKYGLDKKNKVTGSDMFKFRDVSEKTFNLYLQYLNDKYESLLVSAERKN